MKCWQCSEESETAQAVCGSCRALQPPRPERNHFDRLDVPNTFQQDLTVLARHHRALQRQFHPDRFASQDDRQRRFSLEHATALNDAYRVLQDPCQRADYMLNLRGMDVSDESNQIKLDPLFLMDILELREAIDELSGSDTHVERGRIEREVAHRYESTLEELGSGLDHGNKEVEQLAQYAAQLKYLKKILEDLHALAG